MYLQSLATAVPPTRVTQIECAEMLKRSKIRQRLSRKSLLTAQTILRGDSGIQTRHFAMPDIEDIFTLSSDELNEGFRREAPLLASEALKKACDAAHVKPAQLDALLVCTCTGYLCPGVTSYVAEQLNLRREAYLQDLVGQGCGAAIPMLRSADALLAQNPGALIATVAVEICSAAFYLDDDLGVLISGCLFGDGAAAAVWKSRPANGSHPLCCHSFNSHHQPQHRDRIRFEQRDGRLRNLLDPALAPLVAHAVAELFQDDTRGVRAPVERVVSHGGGRDVIDAIEQLLPGYDFISSRETLRRFGNMSSPSVLFALEDALERSRPKPSKDWWLVSFGAGFSVHSCRLSV